MSYGALGRTLGHEILHGFDSVNCKPATAEAKWWTDETKETFNARAECILNQYESGNATLYSQSTITENIPDHGGVKLAYHAYRKYLTDHYSFIDLLPFKNASITSFQRITWQNIERKPPYPNWA